MRNGRGNGALRKLGAMQEGLLRNGLLRNGHYLDQALYTIANEDWRTSPTDPLSGYVHRARTLSHPRSIGSAGSLDPLAPGTRINLAPVRPACSSASRL